MEKVQAGPWRFHLTPGRAATRGISGNCYAPGVQEPHEQPDCKGTSATSKDVLWAHLDTLCLLGHSVSPLGRQDIHPLMGKLTEPLV